MALDQGIPSDKHHRVCINDCYSSSLPVISGVPQGSILGPLLCLVYVNYLAQQVLHSDIFLFADNTKCLNLSHWSQTHLSNWSSNWKFSFNESKCLLLTFQSKSPTHSTLLYSINGHVIRNCHQHKDLGILMSSDLHGRPISPQSPPKRTKSFDYLTSLCVLVAAHQQRKCSTYHALVRSQLVYCLQVWRPSLVEEIKTFEDVQRSATKFILNDYISDYRTHRHKLHIMLPLSMLHELNDICFFVKSLKQAFISFTITDYVSFSGNNTRSGSHHKSVQPMATTTRLKHFYFNRLPHLWNSLPPSYQYIKKLIKSRTFSGNISFSNFDSSNSCTYHFCCPCTKCLALTKSTFKLILHAPEPPLLNSLAAIIVTHYHF